MLLKGASEMRWCTGNKTKASRGTGRGTGSVAAFLGSRDQQQHRASCTPTSWSITLWHAPSRSITLWSKWLGKSSTAHTALSMTRALRSGKEYVEEGELLHAPLFICSFQQIQISGTCDHSQKCAECSKTMFQIMFQPETAQPSFSCFRGFVGEILWSTVRGNRK